MSEVEKGLYIICDNEDETEIERALMEQYWVIDPEDEKKFLYNICDIEKRLEVPKNTLLILARSNYRVTGSHPRFTCIVCKGRLFVKNRGFYFRSYRSPKCEECQALEKAEKIRKEELKKAEYERLREAEVAERLRLIKAFEKECFQSDYSINDLSYIEAIFIFLWLSDKELSNEGVQLISKRTFETVIGVTELDEIIIRGLVSKGCIVEIGETRMSELRRSGVLNSLDINYGHYLKICREYSSMYDFCSGLHERFSSGSIKLSDIGEISSLVELIRMNNLYGVVHWLEREHRIEIKRNTKLDCLLRNLSCRFSLIKCTYVMFLKAKEVAAYIHSKRPDRFIRPHLFTSFIDSYLIKFDTYGWKQNYYRMPKYAETTALESLVCEHYSATEYNWFRLTTGEVLSEWIGSLNVLGEECISEEE